MIARAAVVAVIVAAGASAPAAAMGPVTAKRQAIIAARQSFGAFTDKQPRITAACHLTSHRRARCRISYRGDRLRARMRATVLEHGGGYDVRFSRLQPIPRPQPKRQWSSVLASWYGADFYGHQTGCGQTYNATIMGVANKTLACGTLVTIRYGGRQVTVPVIDRGPYSGDRVFDLSNAVRLALGFDGVQTVQWHLGR